MILIGYVIVGLIVASIRWGLIDDVERFVDGGFFSFFVCCFWPVYVMYWAVVTVIMGLGFIIESVLLQRKAKKGLGL